MKKLFIFILSLQLFSCSKSTPVIAPPPGMAVLLLPLSAAACTSGTVLSATQSTINFSWTASLNTTSYGLSIKNLLTGITSTQVSSTNSLAVNLLRNTPYSWYVVSESTATTVSTHSLVFKFYNAGPGIVSYPPFPATITAPLFGQSVTATNNLISLTWAGSSVSNNITSYDVYFGTATVPVVYKSAVSASTLTGVPVVSGTTYYWKVITHDLTGNTSDSGVYTFTVN